MLNLCYRRGPHGRKDDENSFWGQSIPMAIDHGAELRGTSYFQQRWELLFTVTS